MERELEHGEVVVLVASRFGGASAARSRIQLTVHPMRSLRARESPTPSASTPTERQMATARGSWKSWVTSRARSIPKILRARTQVS